MKRRFLAVIPAAAAIMLSACGGTSGATNTQEDAHARIEKHAESRVPYEPKHDVEYNNYNRAQKLYDSPDTIQWCTTTWSNPSAPIVTIPIAGKLTSSSVSFFPSMGAHWNDYGSWLAENKSVDGMYHGSPPPYRYGFTPGGQYVDFSGMEVQCTTALTKFTRQATKISMEIDPGMATAQKTAEEALKNDDPAAAQKALEDALNG